MIKKVISTLIAILLVQPYQVNVNAIEVINTAPIVSGFDIVKRNKVDIVILTDYVGEKYNQLNQKLNQIKMDNLNNNNVDMSYTIVNKSINLGTQNKALTKKKYTRYLDVTLLRTGRYGDGPTDCVTNEPINRKVEYETTYIYNNESLPSFKKGNEIKSVWTINDTPFIKTYSQYVNNGISNYVFYFYDPKLPFSYDGDVSYLAEIWRWSIYPNQYMNYELKEFKDSGKWENTYPYSENITPSSSFYSIDLDKINDVKLRNDSQPYVVMLTDNERDFSYDKQFGEYYPFGNLNSNVSNFIIRNKANLISVMPNNAKTINMSTSNKYLTYPNTSKEQTLSVEQLASKVGSDNYYKSYDPTEIDAAFDNIIYDNQTSANGNIDITVATDYSGSKLTGLRSSLDKAKNNLSLNGYNLKYDLISESKKVGNGTATNLKVVSFDKTNFYIKSDHTLWAIGHNLCRVMGETDSLIPIKIMDNVSDISAVNNFIVVLKTDGSLWATGDNSSGQFGNSTTTSQNDGIFIDTGITGVEKVKASTVNSGGTGKGYTLFLSNGNLYGMGDSLGLYGGGSYTTPSGDKIYNGYTCTSAQLLESNVKDFFTRSGNTYVLKTDKTIICWGDKRQFSGYYVDRFYRQDLSKFFSYTNFDFIDIKPSGSNVLALTSDGEIYFWGSSDNGQSGTGVYRGDSNPNHNGGIGFNAPVRTLPNISNFKAIDSNGSSLCGITSDGIVYYWGYNKSKELYFTSSNLGYWYPFIATPQSSTKNMIGSSFDGAQALFFDKYGNVYGGGSENFGYEHLKDAVNIDVQGIDTESINKSISSARKNSDKYFICISSGTDMKWEDNEPYGNYFAFGSLTSSFVNLLKNNDYAIYSITPYENMTYTLKNTPYTNFKGETQDIYTFEDQIQDVTLKTLLNSINIHGDFYRENNYDINNVIQNLKQKYKNNFIAKEASSVPKILTNECIDYVVNYSDFEVDPKYLEEWKYIHDPKYFENSNTYISNNNTWGKKITQFTYPGKYDIYVRAKDNPLNDDAFDEYRLWSNPSEKMSILVHRVPIAVFTYKLTESGINFLPTFTNTSYDLDRYSTANKGINTSTVVWKWKEAMDLSWTLGKPTTFASNSDYYVFLQVQDVDGAWSEPYIQKISTLNFPPDISANPMSYEGSDKIKVNITVTDKSNDLISSKYQWMQSTDRPTSWLDPSDWITKATTSKYNYYSIPIPDAGTWYLHVDAEDEYGNYRYTIFGPYIVNEIKIHDFTVTSMSDLNWRDYYFSSSDSNDDGKLEYLAKNNVNITTIKMPINYYGLISNSNNAVKAGATVKGFILIDGTPDSGLLMARYTDIDNAVRYKDLTLTTADNLTYFWQMIIPKDIKQDTFIEFSVLVSKSSINYDSAYWIDVWDNRNTTRKVFFVHGNVMSTIKNNQTH